MVIQIVAPIIIGPANMLLAASMSTTADFLNIFVCFPPLRQGGVYCSPALDEWLYGDCPGAFKRQRQASLAQK